MAPPICNTRVTQMDQRRSKLSMDTNLYHSFAFESQKFPSPTQNQNQFFPFLKKLNSPLTCVALLQVKTSRWPLFKAQQ